MNRRLGSSSFPIGWISGVPVKKSWNGWKRERERDEYWRWIANGHRWRICELMNTVGWVKLITIAL